MREANFNSESSDGQRGHDSPKVRRQWVRMVRREDSRRLHQTHSLPRQEHDSRKDDTGEVGPPVQVVEGGGGWSEY